MKILLLEDDLLLSEVITEHLEEDAHKVSPVYNGIEAEDLIFKEKFDLFLFDVNVPLLSGFELLKEVREIGNKTPTIFLTSMNTAENVLEGFELGANDYLKKPFEMMELMARINNIKRNFKIDEKSMMKVNEEINYDSSKNMLYLEDREVELSKKEGEFLLYLLKHKGEMLKSKDLMMNVWSYDSSPSDSTIRTYVKKIRHILGENSITTVWGTGYILFDKVEVV